MKTNPPAPEHLVAGAYALGLSALVFSHWLTWVPLDLFLAPPRELGTHTLDWMDWLGAGCLFVGLVNLAAARWRDGESRRQIAGATAAVFGVWFAQNLAAMASSRFRGAMWLHVAGCGLSAALCLRAALNGKAAAAPSNEPG